ncbi:MAG: hypothetical protein ACTHK3_01770 [Solirubrobacterales bacterium]
MNKIRKRLTYANVMSSIAVFLVIGGATAFAALGKNTVGTKQLKKNAVTTAKIKNNAVTTNKIKNNAVNGAKVKDGSLTGADINLGALGTVPSAANANTVGGNSVVLINFQGSPTTGPTQILNLNGFTLTASCNPGDETVVLANGPTGSRLQSAGQDSVEVAEGKGSKDGLFSDSLTPTSNINLLYQDDDLIVGNTEFSLGNGGRAVSVVWEAEGFGASSGPHCTFTGYAIG